MKPKISLSVADLPLDTSYDQLFYLARELNLDGIEIVLGLKTYYLGNKLQALSEKSGVPILSIHQPLSFTKLFYPQEDVFKMAKSFNVGLVIHPIKNEPINSPRQKRYFESQSAFMKQYSIKVMLENMGLQSSLPLYRHIAKADTSTTDLLNIYKVCKQYEFGMVFDTSHFKQGEISLSDDFQKVFPRIENIHLSDFTDDRQHLSLGRGEMNVKDFLKFLKNKNYTKIITLEISPHVLYGLKEYRKDVRASIEIIRKYMN